ncbi:MAG: hypothetical protein WCO10_02740 [bacterium]
MKILQALGLGLAIVILRYLVPDLFSAFIHTLLQFFGIVQSLLGKIQILIGNNILI